MMMMTIIIMMMIIIIITTITTTIIIIALNGSIRDFFNNHLTSPGTVSISRATHRALTTCNMHATWYGGAAQLLSLTEFKSHLFKWGFFYYYYLPKPLTDEGGEETGVL